MKTTALKLLILAVALGGLGWAADDEDPGRGVARISLINGDVSVRRGDSSDWVAAVVNAPLVVEDQLLTGSGSSAELQFDWANVIRLSADTEIHLAELESQRYMLHVARGTVTFSVLRDSDSDVEIDTPSVSVRPQRKGDYRITVREDGSSEITVRSGEADIFTPRGSERLRSGKTMLARGPASEPEYQIVSAMAQDNWDRWNEDRDRYYERAGGYRYVDRSIYGVEDLDGYGSWVYVGAYGWVWAPRVTIGWAPYYFGRWSWIDFYGWTWISYDPWGWAPFHYGRWFYEQPYGWCWFPGPLHTRHPWRPALVAFFGWGNWGGLSVGAGIGHVGWVPLAPHETYHPWYGRGYYGGYQNTTYIDNGVRIVNNTNIVNIYRNARIANAVTAVDASQFGSGNRSLVRVRASELSRVDLINGQLPVAPGRESLRFSDRQVNQARTPRATPQERFFSRRQPAQVERVPFDQQQRGMEQTVRRTFGGAAAAAAQTVNPRAAIPAPPAPAQNNGGGWRRLGEPAARPQVRNEATAPRQSAPPAPAGAQGNAPGNWRRFEGPRNSEAPAAAPDRSQPQAERATPGPPEPPSGGNTVREAPRANSPSFGTPRSQSEGGTVREEPDARSRTEE